jgi:hypothetical protein
LQRFGNYRIIFTKKRQTHHPQPLLRKMSTSGKLSLFDEVADFPTRVNGNTPPCIGSIDRAQKFTPGLTSRGSTGRMIDNFVIECRRVSQAKAQTSFFKIQPGGTTPGGAGGPFARRASILKTKMHPVPIKHHHNLSPLKGSSVDMVNDTPTFSRTVFNPKTKLEGTVTGAFVSKYNVPKPNFRVRPSFSAPG